MLEVEKQSKVTPKKKIFTPKVNHYVYMQVKRIIGCTYFLYQQKCMFLILVTLTLASYYVVCFGLL